MNSGSAMVSTRQKPIYGIPSKWAPVSYAQILLNRQKINRGVRNATVLFE